MRLPLALAVALLACGDVAPAPALDVYVAELVRMDEARRLEVLEAARLDRAAWERAVVDPYRGAYEAYARAFDAALPRLAARLASRGAITVRAHHAGDPRLTRGQARARWALPVQAPSWVVEIDAQPVDAVFVRTGPRWAVVTGIDDVVRARATGWSPSCAAHLELVRPGRCEEISWEIAEAALRSDRARFDRTCALAANLCR